jgi:hypothetical protein
LRRKLKSQGINKNKIFDILLKNIKLSSLPKDKVYDIAIKFIEFSKSNEYSFCNFIDEI